ILRLVDEEDVHLAAQILRAERGVRAAGDHELSAAPELGREIQDVLPVDHVSGQTDDVGIGVEVDRLDVLVTGNYLVVARRQAGDGGKRKVGKDTLLLQAWKDPVESPEGLRIFRRNEVDLHLESPNPKSDDLPATIRGGPAAAGILSRRHF